MSLAANTGGPVGIGAYSTAGAASSQLLSIGQGATTAFSMMAKIGQGITTKKQANAAADLEVANAEMEITEGQEEKNRIRRRFAEVLGEQNVAFAAAGLRVGEGQSRAVATQTGKRANRDLSRAEINSKLRVSNRLANAAALRKRGGTALSQSIIKSLQTGANTYLDIKNRG